MAEASDPAPPDDYRAALTRYRDTAKWVLTALGATAVAAIAGFGLADFGKLSASATPVRFAVACAGLLLAVVGFFWSIRQALNLASESWTEPTDLMQPTPEMRVKDKGLARVRAMVNDPTNGLLAGYDDFDELSEAHTTALRRWRTELNRRTVVNDDSSIELEQRWSIQAHFLARVVQQATLVASTRRFRAAFETSSTRLMFSGIIATVGVIMFAWAVTAPKADPTVVVLGPTPPRATLRVADEARPALQAALGADCNLEAVPVIVLDQNDKGPSVVVAGTSCNTLPLTVDATVGTLTTG